MLNWAKPRQILGRIAGVGRGFVNFGVVASLYTSTTCNFNFFEPHIRDAEVARSNRVAPIL